MQDIVQTDSSLESSELAQALIELESIQAEQDRRLRDNGVFYYTPNPIQSKAHSSLARICIYCGGNRCIPLETKILMADGTFKALKDVALGDKVICDAQPTTVIATHLSGIKTCYRVLFEDGGSITASEEHEFPIAFGSGKKFKKRPLKDIIGRKTGVPLKARFLSYKNIQFLDSSLPIHPYLIGALLGDGSLKDNFSFTNIDSSVINRVNDLLKDEGCFLKKYNKYSFRINSIVPIDKNKLGQYCSLKFKDKIKSLGINHNCYSKFIPKEYLTSSVENRKELLAGLIDTDGSLDEFTSVSKDLAEGFVFLMKSLGGKATITHYDTKHRVYWRLNEKLPLSLGRKQSFTKRMPNYTNRVVKEISCVGEVDCGDLTVSSDSHNYVAGDWIVLGNSGKSTFGAVELAMHTVGWYPDWYPQYRRFNRAIKAVIVATEFPVVERVIEPKLRSYMPKDSVVKWKRSPQGYLQRMVVKSNWGGESVIDILTSEMDDMACESADWDFYWGDEPQQKSKFFAIQRGLIDRDGITVLTFTPLIQPWMKTELVDKSDGKKIECFISDIRDNKFDINGKEILKEESIQAFEDMLPDEIKETRIHGKFFHLQGVVYKEFSDVHLRKFDYEQGLPVICVLDPHDRTNHHVIWAFIDKTDDIKVFYELSKHCTLKELAANILGVEEHFGFKMRARLIDPNFGRKPVLSSGKSVIEELSLCGVHFAEANDNIEAGQLKVKQYLHYNRNKPLDINNCPKIFFHKENVPLTIKSLRELQFEEWVGKTRGEKDPKETTKQKDTHGSDVTRYLCMWNPTFSGAKSYQPVFNEPIY